MMKTQLTKGTLAFTLSAYSNGINNCPHRKLRIFLFEAGSKMIADYRIF